MKWYNVWDLLQIISVARKINVNDKSTLAMSWWSWRLGEKYMAVYCYWTYLIFSKIKWLCLFQEKEKKKSTQLSMIKKELWVVWYMDVDGCEAWNYYSHLLPWEKTAGEWNSHIKGIARGITKKWKWDLIKSPTYLRIFLVIWANKSSVLQANLSWIFCYHKWRYSH